MIAVTSILEFLWRNWKLIGWGLTAVAMFAVIYIRTDQRDDARAEAATNAANFALCETAHAVTRQSVDTLRDELKRETDEADARAAAYQDARVEDAKYVAAADARRNADKPRVAMLEAIAAEANKGIGRAHV